MFRSYLTVALRNLVKHKLYSAINIIGLAVGLAACILILLFVRHELTYDRFFSKADRIAQVTIYATLPGRSTDHAATAMLPFAAAFKQDHPEVEAIARLIRQRSIVQQGDAQFFEDMLLADADFLRIFDFPFVAGTRETALDDPSGVVLTETLARKYFQSTDVLGRTLTVDNSKSVHVSGVMKDLPGNTQFELGILLPVNSVAGRNLQAQERNWGAICCWTYAQLKPGTDLAALNAGLDAWMKKTAPTFNSPTGPIVLGDIFRPELRPLTGVHTQPLLSDMRPGTSLAEIYTFSAVALLVLAIASINFMNLATARATQRAREVSVRKVVGASRGQIVMQFIGESVLLTLVGLVLALALVELVLPGYAAFLGKPLTFDYSDPSLLGLLLGLAVLVGVAGGAYPAFFLSGFNPARVLKGASSGVGGGSGRLRTALVVVQFAISIGLMVATAVVHGQLLFAQTKDLGYDRENLLVLDGIGRRDIRDRQGAFLDALRADPHVAAAAETDLVPGDGNENNTNVRLPGGDPSQMIILRNDSVGFDYVRTMGLRLVAGRDFDRNRGGDRMVTPDWLRNGERRPEGSERVTLTGAALLNVAGVQRLGFATAEAAIGQIFEAGGGDGTSLRLTIVGVVDDFHYRSIHEEIAPSYFFVSDTPSDSAVVRIKAGQVREALADIDRLWREIYPDMPIQRQFLDERLQDLYAREQKTSQMFAAFSGLAIIIACLGLFGLASFTAARRTKEIGLRKVLGAGVTDIVRLLVWQFSKPVLLANLIAWPLAWWGLEHWLRSFAYRIDLDPVLFVGAGAAALGIAWLTVGLHAARVAQARPVTALRYE